MFIRNKTLLLGISYRLGTYIWNDDNDIELSNTALEKEKSITRIKRAIDKYGEEGDFDCNEAANRRDGLTCLLAIAMNFTGNEWPLKKH